VVVKSSWASDSGNEKEDRRLPQGILVGLGSVAVIVAAFVAAIVPPSDPVVRYGVLVAMILTFTAITARWAAPSAVALIGFLVFGGFLVNRVGELSWHGAADLTRILALGAAVIFGRLIGDSYRLYRLFRRAQEGRRAMAHPIAERIFLKEDGHDA